MSLIQASSHSLICICRPANLQYPASCSSFVQEPNFASNPGALIHLYDDSQTLGPDDIVFPALPRVPSDDNF